MTDEHELRLLKMVVHAASQQAYRWLHPDTLQDVCLPSQSSQWRGIAVHELAVQDWQELVLRVAARCRATLPHTPLSKALQQSESLAKLLHAHVQSCARHGAEIVVWGDRLYPARLRAIPDPPLALTLLGNTALLELPQVAIVGSRKASPHGLRESFALGQIAAQQGWAVVSGGAYGCDIAAHRGALSASVTPVPAIAVFAGGFSALHPQGNAAVFRDLWRRGGLFVSERLWHMPSRPRDFPVRNRIIAGLSPTLMVMEAGERSGAVLTAGLSLNQGAEVWVLQHPVDDVRTAGSQRLIAEGAHSFAAASIWQQETRA